MNAQAKHRVVEERAFISGGYHEVRLTMNGGNGYTFRYANSKVHLMTGPHRASSNHAGEYRVAREYATRVLRMVVSKAVAS